MTHEHDWQESVLSPFMSWCACGATRDLWKEPIEAVTPTPVAKEKGSCTVTFTQEQFDRIYVDRRLWDMAVQSHI